MMRPKSIAIRLSMGQCRLIKDMTDNPVILGCAEVTAKRLAKPSPNGERPALVTISQHPEHGALFALNQAGLLVQAAIRELEA